MSSKTRLDRLEKERSAGEGWQPFAPLTAAEICAAHLGELPQETATATPEELAKGLAELKAQLQSKAANYEATHQFRWVNGQCQVRALPEGMR